MHFRKKAFGDEWFDLDEDFKSHVVDVLIHVDKPEVVKDLALNKWKRNQEQAEYLTPYSGKRLCRIFRESYQKFTALSGRGF
jgi:hypothetical protein